MHFLRDMLGHVARAQQPVGWEPTNHQCGGGWYGQRWTLETPGSPLDVTTWVVYWLKHGEIYARDITREMLPGAADHGVLLLGCLPRQSPYSDEDAFLLALQQTVMQERNSLAGRARRRRAERQSTLAGRAHCT